MQNPPVVVEQGICWGGAGSEGPPPPAAVPGCRYSRPSQPQGKETWQQIRAEIRHRLLGGRRRFSDCLFHINRQG